MTQPTETDGAHLRLSVVLVVVLCLFGALFARLWFLQVVNAPTAQVAALSNGVRLVQTPAQRGRILDRAGTVIVGNTDIPVIEVQRQTTRPNTAMVTRLATLIGTSVPTLMSRINNAQYPAFAPVPVLPQATPEQILYVREHQSLFPGVTATTETVREYGPLGVAAANIVGYVGQINPTELLRLKAVGYQPGDQIGRAGVEATYERFLRGQPGVTRVQVDSKGNVLGTLSSTPPVQGNDLVLTIDIGAQAAAVSAVEQGLAAARGSFDPVTRRNFQGTAGSAVVTDPRDGSVLALATVPSYDPSKFTGGISEADFGSLSDPAAHQPLLDRTIQGAYAPGSTFKMVTATAALQAGLTNPGAVYVDQGQIKIGNQVFHNDRGVSLGAINLQTAITESSDIYFNQLGADFWNSRARLGPDALQKVARAYGFGGATGVALPHEAAAKIPTPASVLADYKAHPKLFAAPGAWYTGDSAQMAIGQFEDLVTPLQLANAYATFANGGTLYVPRIAAAAKDQAGRVVTDFAPVAKGTVPLDPAARAVMVAGFAGAVNNPRGTAFDVFAKSPLAAMNLAGKTGTAQVTAVGRQNTSVFTSFAPAPSPTYEVTAMMEDSGYGASIAAPVVRQIYDQLFHLPLEPIVAAAATGSRT